ncbi:class I SAM-dependent methyltransferase [Dactylosporangium matsuzakiense]|uniref:class I SAM-dependent methyltransferase n=1 Tax=Dactylosporangium matsuzakiense TaxID=53360 RepID=UPI0021C4B36D|nr:class I SAM-dependent methyltransferase [Dactylosporangium matsuzakiense]
MPEADWIAKTRTSYDTVAVSYAAMLGDALADAPYERGVLGIFAELVRGAGGGPVADIGCGPGRLTRHLYRQGLDAFGVDLSPGMIAVARDEHPDLRFEVGSMTALDIAGGTLGGLLAWFCLIHVPDAEVPGVLAEFRRVLRPGGVALLAFHAGTGTRHKTDGYGGHPMDVYVHRRTSGQVAALLRDAGFTVEAELCHYPDAHKEGAFVFARAPLHYRNSLGRVPSPPRATV